MHDPHAPLEARLADVADKLERLRIRGCTAFGASGHRMKLRKPWPEAKITRFEEKRGITLPPSYRAFLATIGKAGAGPYYGLFRPKRWGEFVDWIADDVPADWLARESPLQPGPNPLPAWDEDDEPPPAALAMYEGVMTLGTRGCTYMIGLVISGPCRGRVVYLDADHHEPPYVGRDVDFLAWYARWLDEQLAGFEDDWFGYGPAGDAETLLRIAHETDDPVLRREALTNLRKPPSLDASVWPRLIGWLDGPDRALVVRLFERAPAEWAARILPLMDDDDPAVRRAAYGSAMALDRDAAMQRLWPRIFVEADETARHSAFHALKDAGRLDRTRLLQLVADPRLGRVRLSALRSVKCTAAESDLLARLLDADDEQLRHTAVLGLLALGEALPTLGAVPAIRRYISARLPVEDEPFARSALIRLTVELEHHAVAPWLLAQAADPAIDDFARLDAVGGLIALGDRRVEPIARQLLGVQRTPKADGRGHTRTIATLVREKLTGSPDPMLRDLGEVAGA